MNPPAGLLDELAQAQTTGMSLAAEDINGGGGAVRVVTVAEAIDDPTATVDAVVDAGITMLVGPVSSSSAASLRDGLAAADVVTCSASATADSLTVAQEGDETPPGRFVRTALPDTNTVSFVADHLAERRAQVPADQPWSVAVVARSDDYGMSVGGGLISALAARGIDATLVDYNPRTVIFTNEVAEVTSLGANAVVLVSYEEGVPLLRSLVNGGIAATEIVGLDGMVTPRLAERTFPDDLTAIDGITLIGSTGNRAFLQRMAEDPSITELIYGAQAYDCAVALALAAEAAGSTEAADVAAELLTVTAGGQTCSSFTDCVDMLRAGEDIDYDGPSGRIAFAANGDPTSGRFTTGTSQAGDLVELSSEDIDLATQARDQAIVAEAAFVSQLQLALRLLGFYQGPIDGILDDEVTAAIAAFQTSVGPSRHRHLRRRDRRGVARPSRLDGRRPGHDDRRTSAGPGRPRLLRRPDRRHVLRGDRGCGAGVPDLARRGTDRDDRRRHPPGHLRARGHDGRGHHRATATPRRPAADDGARHRASFDGSDDHRGAATRAGRRPVGGAAGPA